MGLDLSKIPTKTVVMNEANLGLLKDRPVGVVLVEMLNQVSLVLTFDKCNDAKALFGKFKEAE